MKIRMKVPYDDGTVKLAKGSDGEGLSDQQKKRLVRVGLADEVKASGTAAPKKPKKKSAAKASAPAAHRPLRDRNAPAPALSQEPAAE